MDSAVLYLEVLVLFIILLLWSNNSCCLHVSAVYVYIIVNERRQEVHSVLYMYALYTAVLSKCTLYFITGM